MSAYELGFINVPIAPSFVGIAGKLNSELVGPAREAGKRAAGEVEKSVGSIVQSLERQVSASQKKADALHRAHGDAMAKRELQQQKLNTAVAEQSAAEEKYQAALKKGGSGTAELAKVEKAKAKVTDETIKLSKAERDITDAEKKHADQMKDLQSTSEKYEKAQGDLASKLGITRDELKKLDGDFSEFDQTLEKSGDEAGLFGDKVVKGMAVAGAAFAGLALAAGTALVGIGGSFDDAYDTIRAGTGAAGEDFEGLKDSMKLVATESIGVGSDMGEIGSTLADLNTRLGATGKPLEELTSQFLQLQGMGVDADINTVTAALTQFGVEAEDAPAAMDTLFQISQATGRSMTELTGNLSKSGPALQEFGFGLEESAGLLGQLDKAGLDSEKMLGSMTKALTGFVDEGKNPQEALWGTIASIEELTEAGKRNEALDLAESVFGPKGRDAFVSAVESGQFAYDDFLGSIGATDDTISDLAGKLADWPEKLDNFKNRAMVAVEPLAMVLFDQLAPAIDLAAEKFEVLVGWIMEDLIPAVKQIPDVFRDAGNWIVDNQNKLIAFAAAVSPVVVPIMMAITAHWVRTGVQATISMGKQVAAWVTTQAQAVKSGAVMMQQLWLTGAGWIKAGAQAMAGAARMAAAWVVGLGPIGWVIAAIAAVGTALWAFFAKTETGQKMWATFTEKIAEGWDWVTGKVGGGIDWIKEKWEAFTGWISDAWNGLTSLFKGDFTSEMASAFGLEEDSPIIVGFLFLRDTAQKAVEGVVAVFDWLVKAGQITVAVFATIVITPLVLAWKLLSAVVKQVWESVIKPTIEAFAALATWMWETVLKPAFDGIKVGWDLLGQGIRWVWENVIKVAWDLLAAGITWLYENVFLFYVGLIRQAWDSLGGAIRWVYDSIIKPTWDALSDALSWLYDKVVSPVLGWIGDRWNDMAGVLHAGWRWIDDNVFAALGRGLDVVKGWFQSGVDGIGKIWDGLKRLLAEPINFVIRTVYTGGIKPVFDGVAEKVGLDSRLPDIKEVGGYAHGGILPGYTPGRDPYTFIEPQSGMSIGLSGGEAILRPEATRALGKDWVDNVNAAARTGGVRAVEQRLSNSHFADGGIIHLGNFASGGFINYAGALSEIQKSHAAFVSRFFPGSFALTSASRSEPGSMHDFSRGAATDWQAQDGQHASQMPTPMSKNLARAIATNFPNTAQLIHHPLDGWVNLLNGGPHDYGPGTNAQHGNHVHWGTNSPLRFDGDDIVLDDVAGAGGFRFDPSAWFTSLWDKITGKLPSFEGAGDIARVPGEALSTMGGWVKDWALDSLQKWAEKFMNFMGMGGGGGAEQWADQATEALRRMGYGPEYLGAMLQQIEIESSGNPTAINNWDSNAAKGMPSGGLLQVIDPTYRDVRNRYPDAFEGLPDDRFHPLTNLTAGVGAVKRDWGGPGGRWPTRGGYADGGVIPELFTRDFGGLVPSGALVRNTSGRDEMMLPPETTALMNQFFGQFPEVARALSDATVGLENAAAWLSKTADGQSEEGMTARQSARKVLGLGLDLPGAAMITAFLDGENALWEARGRHIGHLDTLTEKEKALEDARKALADMKSDEGGLSTQDQRKLDDAQKAVDEAKANVAKAESEEKRASATDKLADAEEKLTRIREDVDENAVSSAEKRAEEILKANDDVVKAEEELAAARADQVKDLDNIILVNKASIESLIPQAEGLASQLVAMGVPAAAVSQGLGSVVSGLGGIAALAGPAGVSLGMAFAAVEVVISIIEQITALIERIIGARDQARRALADAWAVIADYATLLGDMQANVAKLQQALVRGLNEQRAAEFALRVAVHDRRIAEANSAIKLAEARQALDDEIARGARIAQLRLMGLHEDWDTYMTWQAWAAQGVLDEWSDQAISQLMAYEAVRAQVAKTELETRVQQIRAEAALVAATRQNARTQADLIKAQERLIRMSADVMGVDLVEATGWKQATDLLVEMAQLQRDMDGNWAGKAGAFLGTSGPWSNEYRGQQARMETLQKTMNAVLAESGISLDEKAMRHLIDQMGTVAFTGGDPINVLRALLPELVDAETALKINENLSPIWDAKDKITDSEREIEDFLAEIDLWDKVTPLEETIKGLEYTIASMEAAASAWAKGNEDRRAEYLEAARANREAAKDLGVDWDLDSAYATSGVRDQIVKEVNIYLDGSKMYTAAEVDALISEMTDGSNVRANTHVSASDLATVRRKELI